MKSSGRLKTIAIFSIFTFFLTQAIVMPSARAQATVVSGQIEKISQLPDGQYEVIVLVGTERAKYLMDSSTVIQALVPVEEVGVGQTVVIPKRAAVKGMTGVKAPGKNLSPEVKKDLGLPNIPELPSIPQVPSVPEAPKVPTVPSAPKAPTVAQAAPKVPSVPGAPKPARITKRGMTQPEDVPAEKAPVAPEAKPLVPQGQEAPPAQATEQEALPKELEGEAPEPPSEARSSVAKREAMFQPTSALPAVTGRKVVKVEKAAEGMKLIFENKEAEVVPASEKIIRLFQIKDLKENMKVQLEVVQDPQGKFVERVTIAS